MSLLLDRNRTRAADYIVPQDKSPYVPRLAELARETGLTIALGSMAVAVPDGKNANRSMLFAPGAAQPVTYDKIHMFDVVVNGQEYKESDHEDRGNEIVTTELSGGQQLGLTVCYDLRFPELYRILATRGALIETVPAAFTYATGEAHWELLLRARAVENQLFVIASNQFGFHDGDRRSYGNSMIVDPWGTVLARAADEGDAVIAAELDFAAQSAIRDKLPSLANRVPGAYSW